MKHEVICHWLGLPEGCWPPDHYTLLGLHPQESDRSRVEQHVHERLAKIRCYQISHPEQATEAMNRLAQAFMCLSDPAAKIAYDAAHGNGNGNGASAKTVKINDDTVTNFHTRIDWQSTAPPVRRESAEVAAAAEMPAAETPPAECPSPEATSAAPPAAAVPGIPDKPAASEQALQREICCRESLRGLSTMPRLIERIDETRHLLWTWDQIGRFIRRKPKQLRSDEEKALSKHLAAAADMLETFPRVIGQPGKPGYRVAAIAQLNSTAGVFMSLDKQQRIALAKDWHAGRQILLGYRRFLYREFKSLRKAGWLGRAVRAVRSIVHDHPVITAGSIIAIVALIAWLTWS